jgi:hypothetical protein
MICRDCLRVSDAASDRHNLKRIRCGGIKPRTFAIPKPGADSSCRSHSVLTELVQLLLIVLDQIRISIITMSPEEGLQGVPFLDDTWFNFGLRVPMPEPPITGCEFRTFLFLIPIIRRDQELAEALRIENDPVTLLTVHLISEAEYQLIRATGPDPLLDLFDEHDYPPIFDPDRPSSV